MPRATLKDNVHTNGLGNFWSLLKRSIKGTYVAVEPFHLFRYLDEQARRYNEQKWTDGQRFLSVLRDVVGRRVTYDQLTGAPLRREQAPTAARPKEARVKEQNPKAPASNTAPEPSALDRIRELTRHIVRVPKAELPKAEKKPPTIAGKRPS